MSMVEMTQCLKKDGSYLLHHLLDLGGGLKMEKESKNRDLCNDYQEKGDVPKAFQGKEGKDSDNLDKVKLWIEETALGLNDCNKYLDNKFIEASPEDDEETEIKQFDSQFRPETSGQTPLSQTTGIERFLSECEDLCRKIQSGTSSLGDKDHFDQFSGIQRGVKECINQYMNCCEKGEKDSKETEVEEKEKPEDVDNPDDSLNEENTFLQETQTIVQRSENCQNAQSYEGIREIEECLGEAPFHLAGESLEFATPSWSTMDSSGLMCSVGRFSLFSKSITLLVSNNFEEAVDQTYLSLQGNVFESDVSNSRVVSLLTPFTQHGALRANLENLSYKKGSQNKFIPPKSTNLLVVDTDVVCFSIKDRIKSQRKEKKKKKTGRRLQGRKNEQCLHFFPVEVSGTPIPSRAQDKLQVAVASFRVRSHANVGGQSGSQSQNERGSSNNGRDGDRNSGRGRGGANGSNSGNGGGSHNNNNNNNGGRQWSGGGAAGNGNKGAKETNAPTLPLPFVDEKTKWLRWQREEELRKQHGDTRVMFDMGWQTYDDLKPMPPDPGGGVGHGYTPVVAELGQDVVQEPDLVAIEETDHRDHAAISVTEIMDIIGMASLGTVSDTPLGLFRKFNTCLTHAMHDLSLSSPTNETYINEMDNCFLCLILSHLLTHLAQSERSCASLDNCNTCSQGFNLIISHVQTCIGSCRQKSRVTTSDLCYEVCKISDWGEEKLSINMERLQVKVRKYCAKVLATTSEEKEPEKDVDEAVGAFPDLLAEMAPSGTTSSLASQTSTARRSLTGNIIASPEDEGEEKPISVVTSTTTLPATLDHVQAIQTQLTVTMTVMPANPTIPSTGPLSRVTDSAAATGEGSIQSFQGDREGPGHAKLLRKASNRSRAPAIPQPIVEEKSSKENLAGASAFPSTDSGKDDAHKLIYQLYAKDGYETQRTYGSKDRTESMPMAGTLHDVEQFMSLWTRPKGIPGIGEVVFGHPSQLKIVAGFWAKKREECEKAHIIPIHHMEEGVILAEHKDKFCLLLTRYQKHHQWERVAHLGNGMSGKCHLAMDLTTNFKFCCKKVHLLRYEEDELKLWSELHHQHIVRLYGAIRHKAKVYIFSEFIDGGTLTDCINQQKLLGRRISHWSAINYFAQLLQVLAYLQSKNMLHEDIKGENILLRQNSTAIVVTDFGTSRHLRDPKELKNKSPVGSPTHWSPEKASMEGHGYPADLWAAVCVLVHMLSGEPPWVKRYMKRAAILNFVIFANPPPMEDVPNNVQATVRDLIQKGFVKCPDHRPSPSELLQHKAFSMLDDGTPETYYSTLISQAQLLNRLPRPAENDQTNETKPEEQAYAEPAVSGSNILYSSEIPVGNYQESDKRLEAAHREERNDSSGGKQSSDTSQSRQTEPSVQESQGEEDTDCETLKHVEPVEGNQEEGATARPAVQTETSNSGAVQELLNPDWDLEKLVPRLEELLPSGDSDTTNSIKSFFTDTYSSGVRFKQVDKNLKVYKPEGRDAVEELPNLSIFQGQMSQIFRQPQAEMDPPEPTADPVVPILQGSPHEGEKVRSIKFQLSSGSDCSSSDLFGSGPNTEVEAIRKMRKESLEAERSSTITPPLSPLSPNSTQLSSGSNASCHSNLQQRKPMNLKLDVSCSSPASRSRSTTPKCSGLDTVPTTAEKRTSPRQRFSQSDMSSSSSFLQTPSTGRLTETPHRLGTSTSSSTGSFFHTATTVQDEQERQLQELQAEMELSQSGSDKFLENDSPTDTYKESPLKMQEPEPYETTERFQALFEESSLMPVPRGHLLTFYNEEKGFLFNARVQEPQIRWKDFADRVRKNLHYHDYDHFLLTHIDGQLVDFYRLFSGTEVIVVSLPNASKEECWCLKCQMMF